MKKIISLILALVMICSLATVAMAAQPKATTGSIKINGVSADNTYEIYRLLDLESYDVDAKAYSYTVNSAWTGFFATAEALQYVNIDDDGYVTWKAAEDDDTVAGFAKKALAYAEANGIDPVQSSDPQRSPNSVNDMAITGTTGIFENLPLGYYLVDSNVGALCGLTTTNPDAAINAKNGIPTITKNVQEDSTNQWGNTNTADIGQTVNFRTTINVHAGAQNYILHDKMSAGLTYQGVSEIRHVVPGTTDENGTLVDTTYYTVVTENLGDDCTFHVVFTQAFCEHLEMNDKVIIFYSAMLNRNAIIAGDGNTNESKLTFGEDSSKESNTDDTTTKTFGFDIVKTDSAYKLIDGAEFKIFDAATDGYEVPVVLMDDGVTYRRARADETGIAIVVKDGMIRVNGFDNGTYFLEETKAPDGYNKLTARQKFIISDGNLDATFNDGVFSTGSGVHVVNKTGSMLPETGAMGTAMFITFGMIVVLGTGLLLVTKKRMSMIQE